MPSSGFCLLPVCCLPCSRVQCSGAWDKAEGECQRCCCKKRKKISPSLLLSFLCDCNTPLVKHFSESHKDLLPFIPSNDTSPLNLSRLCPLPSETARVTRESLEILQCVQTIEKQNKTKAKNSSQTLHSWTLYLNVYPPIFTSPIICAPCLNKV